MSNILRAVVVGQWSASSPSTPTIRVWILLATKFAQKDKNIQKKWPGWAHLYKKSVQHSLSNLDESSQVSSILLQFWSGTENETKCCAIFWLQSVSFIRDERYFALIARKRQKTWKDRNSQLSKNFLAGKFWMKKSRRRRRSDLSSLRLSPSLLNFLQLFPVSELEMQKLTK